MKGSGQLEGSNGSEAVLCCIVLIYVLKNKTRWISISDNNSSLMFPKIQHNKYRGPFHKVAFLDRESSI